MSAIMLPPSVVCETILNLMTHSWGNSCPPPPKSHWYGCLINVKVQEDGHTALWSRLEVDDLGEGVVVKDDNPFIFAAPVILRRQFWDASQMKSTALLKPLGFAAHRRNQPVTHVHAQPRCWKAECCRYRSVPEVRESEDTGLTVQR